MLYVFFAVFILVIIIFTYFFCVAFVRKENVNVDDLSNKNNKFLNPYIDILQSGMDYIENVEHKRYEVFSFDGLRLSARYYNRNSDKTIILFHGYRSSAKHDFSCAVKTYIDLGFNILLADQRSHGLSQGVLITFGVKESRDVLTWIEFLNAKFSPKQIVLSGLSMGATTVLLSLKYEMPQNVKCVVADCGFTSPEEIIKKVAKQSFKINADIFMPILDLMCKIFGKFSIRNVSTVDTVKNSKIPVLLIHGNKDNFVPCEMSKVLYESSADNTELILVDGADHGISFLVDTPLVLGKITQFFNKNLG